jgi:hypothetical protein
MPELHLHLSMVHGLVDAGFALLDQGSAMDTGIKLSYSHGY